MIIIHTLSQVQVERSADGNNFSYLGNMASGAVIAGTYEFDDKNPLAGNNFYRLRIVDNDGKVTYSIVMLLNSSSGFTIAAYPNPVHDNLEVHFQNAPAANYRVIVTDVSGRLYFSDKIIISQPAQSGEMNISMKSCAAGIYYFEVSNEIGKVIVTRKIIRK